MDDLTAFQRDVLFVIAGMDDDPYPHGLSIKETLEQHYSGEVNHGRLYPNLDELAEMCLVEKDTLDKRTNSYALTDCGWQEIDARREWEEQFLET